MHTHTQEEKFESAEAQSSVNNQQKVNILVVDDHPMFRFGVGQFLQSFNVLEATTQQEARIVLRDNRVDLAVVDISLPDGSGLELISSQNRLGKETLWLVLSAHTDYFHQVRARQAGAHGFLGKRAVHVELVDAVHELLAGRDFPAGWSQECGGENDNIGLHKLSERELTVFQLISQGCDIQQIAASLKRSPKTINAIRDRIRAKLRIASSPQLVRYATQWYLSQAHTVGPSHCNIETQGLSDEIANELGEDAVSHKNAQSDSR